MTSAPEENLDVVRRAFDAYQRSDLEGILALVDPEGEIYLPTTLPNSGTYRGHEGFLTWMGAWLEAWNDDFTIEVEDMEAVGARHVVSSVRQAGTGRASGVRVEMDLAYMTEVRDGRLVTTHLYPTRDEALAVAREREEDD